MPLDRGLLRYTPQFAAPQGAARPVSLTDQEKEELKRRRRRLKDAYAWRLSSSSSIMRQRVAKQAAKAVTDPTERQWLVEEVAKIAEAKEWKRRKERAKSGFADRFTEDIAKVGQVAGESAAKAYVDTPMKLIRGVRGTGASPEDIKFLRALESAKESINPLIPKDAPFLQKVTTGAAQMGPPMLGGAAAFGAGPVAAGTYWAAQEFPEARESLIAEGLDPVSSTLLGGVTAGAVGATESLFAVPGTLKGPAEAVIRRGIAKVTGKLSDAARKRGVAALRPEIGVAAKSIAEGAISYIGEVGTEGVQEIEKEIGLQIAAKLSEDVSKRPKGAHVAAFKRGVKGAAPGMLLFAGGSAGLRATTDIKQVRQEKTITRIAAEDRFPSRKEWKRLGLPAKADGEVPAERVRKEVIQKLAADIQERGKAQAELEARQRGPSEWTAPDAPEPVEAAEQPAAPPEAPLEAPVAPLEAPVAPVAPEVAPQQEPVQEGVVAPEGPLKGTILNKVGGARIREVLGIDKLGEEATQTFASVEADVLASDGNTPGQPMISETVGVATSVLADRRPISAHEHMAMLLKTDAVIDGLHVAQADQAKYRQEGNSTLHARASEQIEEATATLDLLTAAGRYGRREAARTMSIGRYRAGREKYDEASLLAQMQAAKGLGLRATKEEQAAAVESSREITGLQEDLTRAEEEAGEKEHKEAKALAEKVFVSQKPKGKVGQKIRSKAVAKQEAIKKRIRQLGIRVNDIIPLSAEGTWLVGQLGVAYIQEGAGTLVEVVEKLQAAMSDQKLSPLDVYKALISRSPKSKVRARTEAAKQAARFKKMARMHVEIDSLQRGVDPRVVRKRGRAVVSRDMAALSKKLGELRTEYYKSEIDNLKLENAIDTINRLQNELENGRKQMKLEPKRIPPQLAVYKDIARQLRVELGVKESLAKVEEQIRTGDYTPPPKRVKKPVDHEVQRLQVQLMQKRREWREMVSDAAPWGVKKVLKEFAYSLKAIKATADISFTMRQNLWMVFSHPILAKRAFVPSMRAFFSQNSADEINNAILHSENADLYELSQLAIQDPGSSDARKNVEVFRAKVLENTKIPVFKQLTSVMRASSRHAVVVGNLMRTSAFDHFIDKNPNATTQELRAMADYINVATGLGNLGDFGAISELLQVAFFSPRFAVSRFQTPWKLATYWSQPRVRKQITRDYVRVVSIGLMVLKLAELAGAEIVWDDPDDPDWLKIRWGNSRFDIFGGFLTGARIVARIGRAPFKLAAGGKPDMSLMELLSRFASFKVSPVVQLGSELWTGVSSLGQETTPLETISRIPFPLVAEDIYDAWEIEGTPTAIGIAPWVVLGGGAQTYYDSATAMKRRTKRLRAQGQYAKANRIEAEHKMRKQREK